MILVLETSGLGNLFGFGLEVSLVGNFGSHKAVGEFAGRTGGLEGNDVWTALPLARSLDVGSTSAATVETLFFARGSAVATKDLRLQIHLDPKNDRKEPFALGAAGTIQTGPKLGKLVVVGSSLCVSNSDWNFNGNRNLFRSLIA